MNIIGSLFTGLIVPRPHILLARVWAEVLDLLRIGSFECLGWRHFQLARREHRAGVRICFELADEGHLLAIQGGTPVHLTIRPFYLARRRLVDQT